MIRPRFPLFGGWRTNYVIGYNVPSYEYLFSSGSRYTLRMRFIDHIFDNMVIDKMTLKVILPERVRDVQLRAPFAVSATIRPVTDLMLTSFNVQVKKHKDEMHYTYLDYSGRPVISASKENLIEKHIQPFEVRAFKN